MIRKIVFGLMVVSTPALFAPAADQAPKPPASGKTGKVDFVKEIKPLFDANCAQCHGVRPTKAYSMLTKAKAFTPGESEEPPIVPGKADQSLIVTLMKAKSPEGRMPQKKPPLKPDQIALIERWINEGAEWPDNVQLTPPPEPKE